MIPHGQHPGPWPPHAAASAINTYAPAAAPVVPPPHAPYYGAGAGALRHPAPPPACAYIQLQSVTAANFAAELDLIGALLPRYPYIVVDTEYPGTIRRPPEGLRESELSPDQRYALVKHNVDAVPIVQLGITLCDEQGNLPFLVEHYGNGHALGFQRGAWEVNFADFDVTKGHPCAEESVKFLQSQGIDFGHARTFGVRSPAFKSKLAQVLAAARGRTQLTWVAFGGAYDLAYLVKMLSDGQALPETRHGFMAKVRALLGGRVFDAKLMVESFAGPDLLDAGLRTVAERLRAPTPPENWHWLAGHKSLTACSIHTVIKNRVLPHHAVALCEGRIDGLQ